ncbi:MAG: NAD-dependent epimerase/dehydratase family protein, partial [Patescibacteria group bacterium]
MTPRSILVTGAAGFIGSNFVSEFKKQFSKTEIVCIDDFSTGRRDRVDNTTVFYEGSVCDLKLLERIFAKHRPEYVFHFAAVPRVAYSVEHPTETTISNMVGTVALLEKAKDYGVKRFIYSSSSSIYGGAKKLPTKEKENLPNPVSPYGLQKYAGEPFCKIFSDLFGVDTVSLRYFNVFGPGQYGDSPYSTVICAWLETLYAPTSHKGPYLEGDGNQSRDFCYVGNVIEANILAMLSKKPLKGAAVNIAHGERTTLLEVKRLVEKFTKKKLELERRKPRLGDVRHTHADISAARKLFGYRPKVDFETGLRKTIQWF